MKTHYFLPKLRFGRLLCTLLLLGIGNTWQGCKKAEDVTAQEQGQGLTDPNEITKVVVIPGATVEQGNPPAVTRTGNEPVLSTPTPTVETISGLETTYTLNYANVTGTITTVYIQFEGASNYLKIPVSGNTGRNGQINIPMRMPADKYTARPSGTSFCTFALMANGGCQSKCSNEFASRLTPRPGEGRANVNGQSVNATALCDFNFAPYGRGYAIMIGQNQDRAIVLYNMRQGSNQLGNFDNLVSNANGTIPTTPFAAYFDVSSSAFYFSVSGSATASGKTVSASGVFRELGGSRQISISASGNCK